MNRRRLFCAVADDDGRRSAERAVGVRDGRRRQRQSRRGDRRQQRQRRDGRRRQRGAVAVLRLGPAAHDRPGDGSNGLLVSVRPAAGAAERVRAVGRRRRRRRPPRRRLLGRHGRLRRRPARRLQRRLPFRRAESVPEPGHGQHGLLLFAGEPLLICILAAHLHI